jgi:hypothetical protein
MEKDTRLMKISEIDLEMKAYPRQVIQPIRVQELLSILDAGEKLDPVVICHIRGRDRPILVDGAHRREAHLQKGLSMIEVEDLGLLTLADALKEGFTRNTRGPMQLTTSDRKLAAQKMLDLGISTSEVEALTHLNMTLIKSLESITYKYEGQLNILPRALRETNKNGSESPLIDDIRGNEKVITSLPRNFSPKATMRHLTLLLDMDWLNVNDKEIIKLAEKLYMKLGALFMKESVTS